jgi:general L-amino acid transport system substrate-binding protein
MSKKSFFTLLMIVLLALVATACAPSGAVETVIVTVEVPVEVPGEAPAAEVQEVQVPVTFAGGGDTLATVQARGTLNCGGNANLPGFGFLDEAGNFSGFDVDYCGVIAAATLGDGTAYEIRPTTGTDRFPVLQSGEVDVLIRNTTWTISRDTSLGFDFAPTTFYDGQGMMVLKSSGITDLEGLEGGTVCVQAGTTTEKNLADVMRQRGINVEAVVFPDAPATREAYDEGRCDGFTTDKSGLVASQTQMKVPADHIILEVTMSKEPLGPLTRHGDNNWTDIVMWSVYCTIQAEEKGIDSGNVDDMLGTDDPEILSLLGVEGDLGQALGLNNDFCYQIIKQVGNYGEIYNRNLGPDTPFDLPRGINNLWFNGGLLYSPPFR